MVKRDSIFSKYDIMNILHSSDTGTVYKVRHRGLLLPRVIKVIDKAHIYSGRSMNEAHILKHLNHPYIPIVYDIEENNDYIYIIEEYIEGESLQSYVINHNLSSTDIHRLTLMLCEVVEYLHNLKPHALLHLDIKPDNIIVTSDGIRLIDYGNAIYEGEAVDTYTGSKMYAAPEQYHSESVDTRSDIYSIGAVILYMCIKSVDVSKISNVREMKLRRIIEKCLRYDIDERYPRVACITNILKSTIKKNAEKSEPLRICVIGTRSYVGTTHIALTLAWVLNAKGYYTLYEEAGGEDLKKIIDYYNAHTDDTGVAVIKGCPVKPDYNQAVNVSWMDDYNIIVKDYGCNTADIKEYDMLIIVGRTDCCGIRESLESLRRYEKDRRLVFISNLTDISMYTLRKITGYNSSYPYPYSENIFGVTGKASKAMERVVYEVTTEISKRTKSKKGSIALIHSLELLYEKFKKA